MLLVKNKLGFLLDKRAVLNSALLRFVVLPKDSALINLILVDS